MQRGSRNSIVTKSKGKKYSLSLALKWYQSVYNSMPLPFTARDALLVRTRDCATVTWCRQNAATPSQSQQQSGHHNDDHMLAAPVPCTTKTHQDSLRTHHNKAPVGSSITAGNRGTLPDRVAQGLTTPQHELCSECTQQPHSPVGGGLQASGGDLEVSSGWLGSAGGTWRELLQFPPERARRMILPLMMSRPKPSWCAKA